MRRRLAMALGSSGMAGLWAGWVMAAPRTVDDVLRDLGPAARARLRPRFEAAGVPYPPPRLHLLAFKDERTLQLWAGAEGALVHVADYAILAASGVSGPKLREGDRQVPEGFYRVEFLNPNSSYHLSIKLDYPNAFDRARAREEGRSGLGGDIFIHGRNVSIGCLAIGDEAIEEVFTAVADVGVRNVSVVVAPVDLRRRAFAPVEGSAGWVGGLYERLARELKKYPAR